jgi:hypothetical protein
MNRVKGGEGGMGAAGEWEEWMHTLSNVCFSDLVFDETTGIVDHKRGLELHSLHHILVRDTDFQ